MSNSCISHFLPSCGRSRITDLAGSTILSGGEYTDELDGAMTHLLSDGSYIEINISTQDLQSIKEDVLLSSDGEYATISLQQLTTQSIKEDVLLSSDGEYATIDLQQLTTQSIKEDVLVASSGSYTTT